VASANVALEPWTSTRNVSVATGLRSALLFLRDSISKPGGDEMRQTELKKTCARSIAVIAVAAFAMPAAIFSQEVSFGIVGGVGLTPDFHTTNDLFPDQAYPTGLTNSQAYSGPRSLIVGPMVELALPRQFSMQVDALHRNLQLEYVLIPPGGTRINEGNSTIRTWEFPLLLKYKLPLAKVSPFLEAGPSFRTITNPNTSDPSSHGVIAGVGAEFLLKGFRIAPVVRYTRWAVDGPRAFSPTNPDEVETLTEFSHAAPSGARNILGNRFRIGLIGGIAPTHWIGPTNCIGCFRSEGGVSVTEAVRYFVGLLMAYELSSRLSIEVDGIYRPLQEHVTFAADPTYPASFTVSYSVLTWQVPVLARISHS
jgi:hypothetical protein